MLFRKCLNTLLKFSPKHQLGKLGFEFYHKLLSWIYLVILSNYLTWGITIILLSYDVEIHSGPKLSSRECFSICHWKLNSISAQNCTKVSLLATYNLIHNFDIICGSDNFRNCEISPNDPNLEIHPIICIALVTLPIIKKEVHAFSTKQRFL